MSPTFVVVGAGQAGGTAAATLRELGFDGRVVLVGEEPQPPYERPPLSKEYLRGEQPFEEALLRPSGWYEEHGVESRFSSTVERLDTTGRFIELAGGERIPFDSALLATGAENRPIRVPGAEMDGVFGLRREPDARRIADAARSARHAVIVGMGFIGSEVAASLRALGLEVTVVEHGRVPLHRVAGEAVGRVIEAIHRDHGVRMFFGEGVAAFEGGSRVEAVLTTAGRRIECDFAVVGVGVEPNLQVVAGSDVRTENGIVVDSTLETCVPGVFAAGDVANHDHPVFGRVRVEHFDNALKMGATAAANMLGRREVFDDPHWFWSDQYDVNVQMAGFASRWDDLIFRGDVEARSFSAFYLSGGVLLSVLSVNRPRDVRRAMPLIAARARPDAAGLRDESVDLRALLPATG